MRGFDYCRPVVVVDGAHLGGAYKGCILPLAYGVVDTENDCSWTWFFEQFKIAFGEREDMCIVSDRNESIMKSAYRKKDFDKLMAKVVKVDHRVKDYLEDAGYEKWSRVHSLVNRGRMMTSNIAECINGCLVDARRLTNSWKKLDFYLVVGTVVPSSEYIFSVYEAGRRYIVCLERKSCTCGKFQQDEIHCAHTIAVLKHKNVKDMHPYCSDYYKSEALAKTYKAAMVLMPDKENWTVPDYVLDEIVLPPRYRRLAGRPRKRRKKNVDEKITVNKNSCGQCGQEGHNKRTCTFFPKEK
ncbi:uncharacterized protein [Solanum tuberosum]|uniref:uncharacterized protein n=1 Tax=Solanum tuberosum TaxID=4113 RepID=UPI00073A3EDB|nr:PREDICTED: uncharacterized protein LOC107061699 [Solanum tuberosum]